MSATQKKSTAEKTSKQVALVSKEMQNLLDLFTMKEVELSEITANVLAEKEKWENEKKLIAKTQKFGTKVKLNVGGTVYETSLSTLTRFPESMLGVMFSGRHHLAIENDGAIFIDRDGQHFREIMKFLRNPNSYSTEGMSDRELKELQEEADFFLLKEFIFPPVQEDRIQGQNGYWYLVFQNKDGLWCIRLDALNSQKSVLTCCRSCGGAYARSLQNGDAKVPYFGRNRNIKDNQPRPSSYEVCLFCRLFG